MLGIIVGLLAGVAGLLVVPLAAIAMVILGPTLGLYQSVVRMAVAARAAVRSISTETHSERSATVEKPPEGRNKAEESRLAA